MDWLAALLELAGVWLVGSCNRWGFILALCCNAIWIAVAARSGLWGLAAISVAMAGVNIRNFRRWSC